MNYLLAHHQIIASALEFFNAEFFFRHKIIFGGGTRIALELDEYRQSVDIDFLCPNKASYRAVREQVTNNTLGELVKKDFDYIREIRADRDAVRTVIKHQNTAIKLEFVSFDDYDLDYETNLAKFPIPVLDRVSCFYTKLLANADRKLTEPYKDIFDILAMYKAWGSIPQQAISLAEQHYGLKVVMPDLIIALQDITKRPDVYKKSAKKTLLMKDEWSNALILEYAPRLLREVQQN